MRGIESLFTTVGSMKININNCNSIDALVTIPGVYEDPEDADSLSEAQGVAQAILDALKEMPDYEVDESRDWWPFKDWSDLVNRVEEDVGSEASQYFSFGTEANSTVFKLKITGESMGMKHEVNAECYVRESNVRYIKWRED